MDRYLVLLPRGLQQVAKSVLTDVELVDYPHTSVSFIDAEEDPDYLESAKAILERQQAKKRQRAADKLKSQNGAPSTSSESSSTKPTSCYAGTVGTVFVDDETYQASESEMKKSIPQHLSIGYDSHQNLVWSCPGQVAGTVWLVIETDAPAAIVAKIRCLGPILALVDYTPCLSTLIGPNDHTDLEVTNRALSDWIAGSGGKGDADCVTYSQLFDRALDLWMRHSQTPTWRSHVKEELYNELKQRLETQQLTYRLSAVRDSVTSQAYPFSRQELLSSALATNLVPERHRSAWTVNLSKFDVEIVFLQQDSRVAVGIALLPYSLIGVKSWSGGFLPPDITTPYPPPELLAGQVRLRPTTANLLMSLAKIQAADVVLDPCGGVGTIPLEADSYFGGKAVGIGGDLILTEPRLVEATNCMATIATSARLHKTNSHAMAWDALQLPIRSGSVDVIVSDLPFGQQCLSAHGLNMMLPLLLQEAGRVLRPTTGRMVILCGASHESVSSALLETSSMWELPIKSALPVNIGGLNAWIMLVSRSEVPPIEVANYLKRLKSLTAKRDHQIRSKKSEKQNAKNHRSQQKQPSSKPKRRKKSKPKPTLASSSS